MNEHWILIADNEGNPVYGVLRDSCNCADDYFNGKGYRVEIPKGITDKEIEKLLYKEQIKYVNIKQVF